MSGMTGTFSVYLIFYGGQFKCRSLVVPLTWNHAVVRDINYVVITETISIYG